MLGCYTNLSTEEDIIDKVYRSNWGSSNINQFNDYNDMKEVALISIMIDENNSSKIVFKKKI